MPGLFFQLDWRRAHECMGLPGVSELDPPLVQGIFVGSGSNAESHQLTLCMCVAARPGTNSDESGVNLRNWIDLVARQYLPPRAFVSTIEGTVIKGLYHHLSSNELQRFIGELAIKFQDWEAQCIANQKSCGWAVHIDGSGGKVTMTSIILGPFRE